jgi:hypothetical protein
MASNIYHISSTSLVELRRTRENCAIRIAGNIVAALTYSEISVHQQRSVTGRCKAVGITIQALVDRPLIDLPRRHQRFLLHPNGSVSEWSESLQKEKSKSQTKFSEFAAFFARNATNKSQFVLLCCCKMALECSACCFAQINTQLFLRARRRNRDRKKIERLTDFRNSCDSKQASSPDTGIALIRRPF